MNKFTIITTPILFLLFLGFGCTSQSSQEHQESPVPDLSPYPWVYVRDDRPLRPEEEVVSMVAVGDVLVERGVAEAGDPLRDSAGWLREADVALGNLEGVLVGDGKPRQSPAGQNQPIILNGDPDTAVLLAEAGFDILGVANNHSLDYGQEGLQETIGHLEQAGIEVIGAAGEGETAEPLFQEIDGLRLAFLAFNALADPYLPGACPPAGNCSLGPASWDAAESLPAITAAKAEADALIVSMHWGYEYQPVPDPYQETAVQAMFDAGADLVVGHHAHVAQKITIYGDRAAAYSVGNFLFDQEEGETGRGLGLRAFFDEQGLRGMQVLPLHAGLQPRLMDMAEAEIWLAQFLPLRSRDGFACSADGCRPAEVPRTGEDGRFYSGQIDLTGDGEVETVRKEGGWITIYEQGTAVWTSPEAWRVVDAALGDPNDDGRYEIMLAIWQADADGYERSQPYIVGHRSGRYDLLWGGRPVADPIRELAVGDVDGDGTDELVVIEETADGSGTAVSVWRWAGWTFTHVWRSDIDDYSGLLLTDDTRPLISVNRGKRP